MKSLDALDAYTQASVTEEAAAPVQTAADLPMIMNKLGELMSMLSELLAVQTPTEEPVVEPIEEPAPAEPVMED